MAFLLEELILNFSVDTDSLERGLDSVSAKAKARAKEIERMAIAPKVDLSGLHELNKLLDVKQRHIRETAQFAARNPIVVKVDTRDLSVARKELKGFKDDLGIGSNHKVSVKVEHQYKVDIRESNRDIAHQIKDLGSGLKDIVKAVNSTKQGVVSKAVGGLLGAVTATPIAIARGALEGVGRSISNDIGKSLTNELESQLSTVIGSFDVIGKGIASKTKKATDTIFGFIDKSYHDIVKSQAIAEGAKISAAARSIGKEITQSQLEAFMQSYMEKHYFSVKRSMGGGLSDEELQQEQSIVAGKRQKRQKARKKDLDIGRVAAFSEASLMVEDLEEEYNVLMARFKKEAPAKKQRLEEISPLVDNFNKKLSKNQKGLSKNLFESELLKQKLANPELTDEQRKEISNNLVKLEKNKEKIIEQRKRLIAESSDVFKESKSINDFLFGTVKRTDELESQLKKAKIKYVAARDALIPNLSVKENTSAVMEMLTGKKISADKMPDVQSADLAGAHGRYSVSTNRIKLQKDLYEILAKNDIDSILNNPQYVQALKTLAHEMAHGVDFDMGSPQGMLAAQRKKILSTPQKVTLGEAVQTSENYRQKLIDFIAQYPDHLKQIELNAEVQARRVIDKKTKATIDNPINIASQALLYQDNVIANIQGQIESQPKGVVAIKKPLIKKIVEKYAGAYRDPWDDEPLMIGGSTAIQKSSESVRRVSINKYEADTPQYKSVGILDDLNEKIESLLTIRDGLSKKLKDLEEMSKTDISTLSNQQINEFNVNIKETINSLVIVGSKLNRVQEQINERISQFKVYGDRSISIEKELDNAVNLNDFTTLQKVKLNISEQIKKIRKDSTLDDSTKAILLSQYKELARKTKIDSKTIDKPSMGEMISHPMQTFETVADTVKEGIIHIQNAASEFGTGFVSTVENTIVGAIEQSTALIQNIKDHPLEMAGAAGGTLLSGANKGVRAIAPAMAATYGVAKGAENVALSLIPYGHLAKKGIQVGAVVAGLPMAASAIPALAPVAGMLGAAHGLGGVAGAGLAAGHLGGIASIPIVGGQVAGLLTSAASGLGGVVAEMGAAALAVNAVSVGTKAVMSKALEPQTKHLIEAQKPLMLQVEGVSQKAVERQFKTFPERAKNLSEYLKTLPESQHEIVGRFLPVVASLQEGYAGELSGQKLSQTQLDLKKIKSLKDVAKLSQDSIEKITSEVASQYKIAVTALDELNQRVANMSPEDRQGAITDLRMQLGNRVKNLSKKAKYLGLRTETIKIEKPNINIPTVDVNSIELPDLTKLEKHSKQSAKHTMEGFSKGAESELQAIEVTFERVAEAGQKAFDQKMGIQSPSRWAMLRMHYVALGLIAGATKELPYIKDMGEMTADEYQKAFLHASRPTLPPPIYIPEVKQSIKDLMEELASVDTSSLEDYNKILDRINDNAFKALNALKQMGQDQSPDAQAYREILIASSPSKKISEDEINKLNPNGKALGFAKTGVEEHDQIIQKAMGDAAKAEKALIDMANPKINWLTSLRNQFPIIDNAIAKFNQFKNLIVSIGVAGAGAIGLFLIGKQLTNIATESVKVYRNFESIFIASKTIANGSEFLGKVRKQVKDLGGDLESAMRQGQQFVTGLQGTNLERTAETLFLDSSKALKSLGLQTQQYDSAILAIKQVASKGKVSLEEISGQLGEAVPGALNIAAQAMQTNVQGFIQMVESGNLLSEEFLPKFVARLKAQTAFLEPEIKKSLNASFGRLGANYTDLQMGIGQSLSPVVATFVNTLSNGLEFINENFDNLLLTVKVLSIAMAMPAAKVGIDLLVKGVWALSAAWQSAIAYNGKAMMLMATTKAVLSGFALGGAALAVTSVVEGAMFLWQNGTQEVKDNTEALKDTVDSIADAYQRAYESVSKLNNPQQGTGNWLLDRIDDFINKANSLDAWIAKMTGTKASPNQTFAGAREEQDLAQLNEQKAQIGLGLFYQRKLKDYQETTNYIQQALKLDDEMAGKRAEILAARIKDPVGNANLIKKLEKQIYDKGGLVEQREKINDRFLPGGQAGIEQTIRLTEQSIKQAEKLGQTDLVKKLNDDLSQMKLNLAKIQDINSQITSGLNRQRLAYVEMNAEIAKRQDKLQRDSISIDFPVLDARIAGKLGETNSGYLLAVNELKRQQMTVNSLIQDQKNRESFISNKLEVGAKSSVRALINKELEQIDRGDISRLESLLKGNQNSKQAIEEITGTLTAFLDGKQSLLQAQKALKDARLAVIQQSRAIEDFNLELARSIYDFNKGVEAKQSEVTGLYRDWQRRIEDSVYNNKIKVRQLSESYSDLMFNLQTQLSTSSNELINIKNQIISEKRKQENLLISPGTDSIARQVNNIFNQLFDSLTNGEQEKRQANLDAAQVQKQYIDTLRQIRQVEEDNIEARKAQSREIEDLTSGYKSLNVQIKEMIEEMSRQRQDAIKKYDREGVNVRPYLQADPNFGYNQRVPFSVPMGKPIVSQPAHPTIVISPVEPVKIQAEIVKVKNPEIPIKVTPKVESPNWKKIIGDQLPPKTQPQADNNIVKEYVFKAAESVQKAINTVNPFYAAPAQAATTNKKMGWEKNLARLLNQYGSQMTVEDFKRAAAKSGISIDALVTQAFIESHFGTKGRGRFTKNPLNYGNDDAGNNKHFKSFGDGLEYAAIKLKKDFFFSTPEDFVARDFKGRYGRYATDPAYGSKYMRALSRMRGLLYNQMRSAAPQEWLVADASEGISNMGSAIYQTNATAQARAKQIEANKKRQREIDKQKLGSLTENWGTIIEFWKQKYPESYNPEIMSKFGNKFIDTRPDSTNKVQPLTKPLKIDASPAMLEKVGITKQIKESTKKAITEGVTEGFNDAVKMPDLQKQLQQVTNPKDLGIAGVPYLTPIAVNSFESAKKLADKQREVNTELAKTKSLVADEKMTTSYLEAIDNLTRLEYTLKEANLAKTRSLFDGQEELRQITRNAKGYQTAQEQNQKVGYDIWKSFEDKRRAIQDANFAEELKQKGWTVQKQKLIEDLQAKGINPAYDEQVKTSLNNLDIQMNQSKVLQQQLTIQNQQIDTLATQTVQTAMARDNEDRRLNAMKEYGDLQANLASTRYNYGGELINNGAVISAQLNALQSLATAKRKVETEQFSPQQAKQYLAMTKELADVNIKQSYVDAIPFLKEFSSSLKDVVLQTTNWRDALKKLLDLAASTILDQLVIKPMQNGIANLANDWGLFGNTNPINPPSNAVGIDNGNNFSGNIINASESISTISKVVPEVTQSFSALALSNAQNQVTEQTALMAFSASLQTATLAVMQFSAGLGGQSIMSGLIGQSVTDAASGGYTGILDIPSLFYNGSDCVPNYADGVESALTKERAMSGRKPYLAALHEGEAVLSTLNGDSALYRSLKRSGTWDELKTGDQIPNFAKGTDGGMSQGSRSQSNRQGDRGGAAYTINVNQTIVTPNASSFNSSERQRNQDLMVRINKSVGR